VTAESSARQAWQLAILLAALGVSLLGTMMSFVAVPWFVMQMTGEPRMVSLSAFFVMLPAVAGGLLGGALTDRFGAKRISVISDITCFAGFALIFILHYENVLTFPGLLALILLGNFMALPGGIARRALLSLLSERSGWTPQRVSVAYSIIQRATVILGPTTAGLLVSVVDPATVILVDAGTYLFSALAIGLLVRAVELIPGIKRMTPSSLIDGFRLIAARHALVQLVVCFGSVNIFINAINFVAIPILARSFPDPSAALGLTVSAFGAGAMTGTLLHPRLVRTFGRWPLFRTGLTVICLSLLGMAALQRIEIAIVAQFLIGLGTGATSPFTITIVTEETAEEVRGRVFGSVQFFYESALPVVILVFGWFYGFGGIGLIFVAAAAVIGLALAFNIASFLGKTASAESGPNPEVKEAT
jgi:MFS family permease